MIDVSSFAKTLIIIGIIVAIFGIILLFLGKIPLTGFKLPGDMLIKGKNFTIYFPLGFCILISIILTILLRILK